MPGFLRKKTSNAKSSAAQAQPPKTILATSTVGTYDDAPPTPLYSQFASTKQQQQEQPTKPMVSGPMVLASRKQMYQEAEVFPSNRSNDYNRQIPHGANRSTPDQHASRPNLSENTSSSSVRLIASPNRRQSPASHSPIMGSFTSIPGSSNSTSRRAPQTPLPRVEKPLPGAPLPPSKDLTARPPDNSVAPNQHPQSVRLQEAPESPSRRFSVMNNVKAQPSSAGSTAPEPIQSSQQRRLSKVPGNGNAAVRPPPTSFSNGSTALPHLTDDAASTLGGPVSASRPPSRSSVVSPTQSTVGLPTDLRVTTGPSRGYPNGRTQGEQLASFSSPVGTQRQLPPHRLTTRQSPYPQSRPSQREASAGDMKIAARNSHHPPASFSPSPTASPDLPNTQPLASQSSHPPPSGPRRMSVQAPLPQQHVPAPVQRSASVTPNQRTAAKPLPAQEPSGLTRTPSKGPLIFAAMASVRSNPYPLEAPPTPPTLEQYLNKWGDAEAQPPAPGRNATINGASPSRPTPGSSPPRQLQAQHTGPQLTLGQGPRRQQQSAMQVYQQQHPQQQQRVNGMPLPSSSQLDPEVPPSFHHPSSGPPNQRNFSPPKQPLHSANGDQDAVSGRDYSEGKRKMSKSSMRSKKRLSDDFSSAASHAYTQSTTSMSSNTHESASTSHPHGHPPGHSPERSHKLTKARPGHSGTSKRPVTPNGGGGKVPPNKERSFAAMVDEEVTRKAGLPLDDDPFAKPDIVTMVGVSTTSLHSTSRDDMTQEEAPVGERYRETSNAEISKEWDAAPRTPPRVFQHPPRFTPSPEDYKSHRSQRRGDMLERIAPPAVVGVPATEDRVLDFPLESFVLDPDLLVHFLPFLSFYEWTMLWNLTKRSKMVMEQHGGLREAILGRYLKMVGYETWAFEGVDPLALSLKDIVNYMRGVSMPTFQYSQISLSSLNSRYMPSMDRVDREELTDSLISAAGSTRAYTRVVLRLRCQAEAEVAALTKLQQQNGTAPPSAMRSYSRPPSPTFSSVHGHGGGSSRPPSPHRPSSASRPQLRFRSPLFRPRRAPLLRVFVPNAEGDWLSDASVLECEAELRRAGVIDLLRPGDVVWDVAVGDEGNLGRMVWDGSYLIDLDYAYSTAGDLPKYLHSLSFPPSYFHRVLRTGSATNPIIRVDISPWGDQVATNLQLLQDRVRTETPQGASHNVVRWVHRSSFIIRPPPPRMHHSHGQRYPVPSRIAIRDAPQGTFVDHGWYGTIVVETEGTNEHLAELQERCGPGAFPPRIMHPGKPRLVGHNDSLKVWRILREKSRPGEIWIRTVSENERIN
jgi:hypothetical protein